MKKNGGKMVKWKAKKENMNSRVNTYTTPGVSEIIYSDEWEKNNGNDGIPTNDGNDKIPIDVYVIGLTIVAIILYIFYG